jgi:hypothetical protein
MKLRVANLLPNPHDKGAIDRELIQKLRASFREAGMDGVKLVARTSDDVVGCWEIDDGKHSIIAIKEEFGPNHMLDVEIKKLTDEDLFLGWLYKNTARRKVEDDELRVIVERAEQYLLAHPEICPIRKRDGKIAVKSGQDSNKNEHKCPSRECISIFLHIDGLSPRDITRLFSAEKKVKVQAPETNYGQNETLISTVRDSNPTEARGMDRGTTPQVELREQEPMSALATKINKDVEELEREFQGTTSVVDAPRNGAAGVQSTIQGGASQGKADILQGLERTFLSINKRVGKLNGEQRKTVMEWVKTLTVKLQTF